MSSGVFPSEIITAAQASDTKWDIPASVCLAQWALESAWGRAMPPGSNNPFGIKAIGDQPRVACVTHEVVEGKTIEITAQFRAFASLEQAFDAHGELLATAKPYAKARTLRHDPDAFAAALTGVYASDPHYGEKLIGLMHTHGLHAYDAATPAVPGATTPPPEPAPAPLSLWQRFRAALTG